MVLEEVGWVLEGELVDDGPLEEDLVEETDEEVEVEEVRVGVDEWELEDGLLVGKQSSMAVMYDVAAHL